MSVIDFLKRINILKVAELVASSWDEIDESTLRLSWRKILFDTDAQGQQSSDDYAEKVDSTCTSVSEIHSFFQQVGQDVSHSEIEDWLRIDDGGDSGYQHLTDDEIVSQISSAVEEDDDDEQPNCSPQTTTSISNEKAVKMFDKCLEFEATGRSVYLQLDLLKRAV